MKVDLTVFRGTSPLVAPHLLPEGGATVAQNCDLGYGDLRPLKGAASAGTLSLSGDVKSLYRYLDQFWFESIHDVDIVRSPIPNDTEGRVYLTSDDDAPQMTYASVATSSAPYPSVTYKLGVPAPTTAPTASINGGSPSDDIADERDRVYVYTFANKFGEESAPSEPSSMVTVSGTQTVEVGSMEQPPAGDYVEFTQKHIYRTDDAGAYRYVGSVDAATTAFTDDVEGESLGDELITTDWNPPREDLRGLTFLPGGTLVGFSGKTVCFSVPNQPHAWPVAGEYVVHDDIVAIGTFGSSVLVATVSYPVIITGADYESMSVERLEMAQACLYKRGMVDLGSALAYPSPDGLTLVGSGTAKIVTAQSVDRTQWQRLIEGFRFAEVYNGQYIAFTDSGGFIVNLSDGSIVEHDIDGYGGYLHEKTGELYITRALDSGIYQWDEGDAQDYVWRSKEYLLPMPANFGFLQIVAESYPVTATLYADGTKVGDFTAQSERAVRLPGGFRARVWEAEITGTSRVLSVHVAQSGTELKQG